MDWTRAEISRLSNDVLSLKNANRDLSDRIDKFNSIDSARLIDMATTFLPHKSLLNIPPDKDIKEKLDTLLERVDRLELEQPKPIKTIISEGDTDISMYYSVCFRCKCDRRYTMRLPASLRCDCGRRYELYKDGDTCKLELTESGTKCTNNKCVNDRCIDYDCTNHMCIHNDSNYKDKCNMFLYINDFKVTACRLYLRD